MTPNHHNHLKKALSQLPVYEPRPDVWNKISKRLPKRTRHWLLAKLPVYEAPEFIWTRVLAQLDQHQPVRPTIRKLYRYAALLIGLLLGSAFLFNQITQPASNKIAFSVEQINPLATIDAWESDEDAFLLLEEICQNKSYTCTQPEFTTMKAELDELNSAHHELKKVLTAYNEDPVLLNQLTQIERQRTDLLKTLFAKI